MRSLIESSRSVGEILDSLAEQGSGVIIRWWISPDGEKQEVPWHAMDVYEQPRKFDLSKERAKGLEGQDREEAMLAAARNGWIAMKAAYGSDVDIWGKRERIRRHLDQLMYDNPEANYYVDEVTDDGVNSKKFSNLEEFAEEYG